MAIDPFTGQTIISPAQSFGQALLRQPRGRATTAIGGLNVGAQQLLGAFLTRQAADEAEQQRQADAAVLGKALEAFRGGGRGAAVDVLSQSGSPRAQALAFGQILSAQPEELFEIEEDGRTIRVPRSQAIGAEVPGDGPDLPRVGATRTFRRANEQVTEEFDGERFVEIATGPAFAPGQPRQPERFVNFFNPDTQETASARQGSAEAEELVQRGFRSGNPPRPNQRELLAQRIAEVGFEGLTPQERDAAEFLQNTDPLRAMVRDAVRQGQSPNGDGSANPPQGEVPPRPADLSDAQILERARNKVRTSPESEAEVRARLKAWGIDDSQL